MAMRPYAQRPCPSHRRRKAMTSNAASPLPCRSFARMHLCACKKRRRVPYTAPTNAVYEALLRKQDGSFFAAHPQAKPRYHIPREKATLPYGIRNGISRCGQRHAAAKNRWYRGMPDSNRPHPCYEHGDPRSLWRYQRPKSSVQPAADTELRRHHGDDSADVALRRRHSLHQFNAGRLFSSLCASGAGGKSDFPT